MDTYSEAWRAETEARLVLSWPLEKRREYLDGVEKLRGKEGADYLKKTMTQIHSIRSSGERGSEPPIDTSTEGRA